MQNVILVIHILACLIMIGLVLVQKSEGGGLGIGGGGGANSLLSGRGAAGAVVRSTIIFGSIFFITSLALTTIANRSNDNRTSVEKALGGDEAPATPSTTEDLFDPSAPLLSGQQGLSDPTATDAGDATQPEDTAEPADTTGETEDPTAPDTGNPQ
ncbi:MAG: preprotein translocase subunit SecG [Hyphomonas sp.]